MSKKHDRPYRYAAAFGLCLTLFSAWVLLDAFVLPHAIAPQIQAVPAATASPVPDPTPGPSASQAPTPTPSPAPTAVPVVVTDTHYSDEFIQIELSSLREYNADVYVADIRISQPGLLRTAFAENTFGTNITAHTSVTAQLNGAILAVNGDYYGAHKTGYVLKNGVVYRDSVRSKASYGDLAVYDDGSFGIVYEGELSAEALLDMGVAQLLSFGPGLVDNGAVLVTRSTEVTGGDSRKHPRTAIGIVEPLHYIFLVCDGRTSQSRGLTLLELAELMVSLGCTTAYNLDGGGSSTLWFNGRVVNNPTTNGSKFGERAVSDIVYISLPA